MFVSKIFVKFIFLFLILLLCRQSYAGKLTLEKDISDGYLDDYSKIEAAFILSGITDSDSLQIYLDWYDQLMEKIKSFDFDINDPVSSAQTVFMYLHSTWLKTYALESTTLKDIVRKKEFNCVAATILYNIICEDLNWDCEAFETPSHVYTIFKNFGSNLMVENTSSMGFNIMKNLKAYSRFLAQFYPERDVLRIGLDKLYYYENSRGRVINNTELLGLLAYNRAYLAKKNNEFKNAYDYVLLAQQFNRDSRSNIRFEIGLYYAWGKKLFADKNFTASFNVFADAYYRYPENEDFIKNTIAALFQGLQLNWQNKEWPKTAELLDTAQKLEILSEQNRHTIYQLLNNWKIYSGKKGDEIALKNVELYLEIFK